MARRKTKHRTGLARLKGVRAHDVWIGYVCLTCKKQNVFSVGGGLLDPREAFANGKWTCQRCGYLHSKDSPLPFKEWPPEYTDPTSVKCQRFWEGFFRIATEDKGSYWKQCNTCGRVLPANAFSRHIGWGPLEKQMECRSCKGAINAYLNPMRTRQQLHEAAIKRRVGDLLLEGENQPVDIDDLFARFNNKCFKTGKVLDKDDRKSWAIDHILPSRWLYPLSKENAALLSAEANNKKRDGWPSNFYTNNERINLARITGADLALLSRKEPVINEHIDVDECVTRYLQVREGSDLAKRIKELKKLLEDYDLVKKLSALNKRILGYDKK